MATGLGHGVANAIIWHGRNDHASTTIERGQVVSFRLGTVVAFDSVLGGDPIFSILPNVTIDATEGEGGIAAGIARHDIPAGKIGEFVVLGLVQARCAAAQAAVGNVLTVDATSELLTATSGAHQAPCAINLEVVSAAEATANTAKWCFVDFISGSFGGDNNAVAAERPQRFWGTDFVA
jgi:hypothetical protein